MMFFDGQHVCKSPEPCDAVTFNLTGAENMRVFNGVLKVTIDKGSPAESRSTVILKIDKDSQQVTTQLHYHKF